MKRYESENELLAKEIFAASVDGIIIINDLGVIETINPSALAIFGYTAREVIGKNISMLMPKNHARQHDDYLSKYRTTREKSIIGKGRELEGLKKDGTIFPFRIALSEVKLKSKTIFTGFIHDISEQKQAENILLDLKEKLENKVAERTENLAQVIEETQFVNQQLQEEIVRRKDAEADMQSALKKELELGEMKSRFVAMASHEFRTPLTGILSSITLIEKYDAVHHEEKKQKQVDRIRSSVKNLTTILNDFLSFDKLQAGKIKCKAVHFDFTTYITDLIEEVSQLKKTGQEIELIKNHEVDEFFTDPLLLKNVLLNLFSNAIKYTGENKVITVISELDEKGLKVKVIDKGIGIPKDEQVHLFERFFRARNANNIQGTGLGLNIVQQYVKLMEGTINFESKEGEGSTFKVFLPFYNTQRTNTTDQ